MIVLLRLIILYIGLVVFALLMFPGLVLAPFLAAGALMFTKPTREAMFEVAGDAAQMCKAVFARSAQKEANKVKIMQMFSKKNELTNSEIRKELEVTDRSVVNYMDELEKEGKVEQVGKTGRDVYYVVKNK